MTDLLDTIVEGAARRHKDDPEHRLQVAAKKWTRQFIDADFEFTAFDRSKKASQWQHMREKARGLVAGTADVNLSIKGFVDIWAETKWGDNRPSKDQEDFGIAMRRLGRVWFPFWSLTELHDKLVHRGVPMRPLARLHAEAKDRELAISAAIKKDAPPKRARTYRPRAEKPTAARVRRWEKIRTPGGVLV